MSKKKDEREKRIEQERKKMKLKPWQLAPSEVDDGPSPYPAHTAGGAAWEEAQRWREEILERDPDYFDGVSDE